MSASTTAASAVIAASRRAERRIIETLKSQGATDSAHAVPLPPRAFSGGAIRRLSRAGAIIAVGDAWWVDEATYAQFRISRRNHALLAVLVVLVVIALIAAAGLATR